MKSSPLIAASLLALTLSSCAGTRPQYYNHTQLSTSDSLHAVIAVELIDGAEIHFAPPGAVFSPSAQEVKGETRRGRLVVIPMSQINSCMAEHSSESH